MSSNWCHVEPAECSVGRALQKRRPDVRTQGRTLLDPHCSHSLILGPLTYELLQVSAKRHCCHLKTASELLSEGLACRTVRVTGGIAASLAMPLEQNQLWKFDIDGTFFKVNVNPTSTKNATFLKWNQNPVSAHSSDGYWSWTCSFAQWLRSSCLLSVPSSRDVVAIEELFWVSCHKSAVITLGDMSDEIIDQNKPAKENSEPVFSLTLLVCMVLKYLLETGFELHVDDHWHWDQKMGQSSTLCCCSDWPDYCRSEVKIRPELLSGYLNLGNCPLRLLDGHSEGQMTRGAGLLLASVLETTSWKKVKHSDSHRNWAEQLRAGLPLAHSLRPVLQRSLKAAFPWLETGCIVGTRVEFGQLKTFHLSSEYLGLANLFFFRTEEALGWEVEHFKITQTSLGCLNSTSLA